MTGTPAPPRRRVWPWLAVPVIAAVLLAIFPLHNDDAGFHIANGRWILQHGAVPLANPFSYAHDGAKWVQHQWLPAIGMTWLVDQAGVPALVLAKAALVGSAFAIAAWTVAASGLPGPAGALVLVVAIAASAFRFQERPYLFSVIALSAVVAASLAWRSGRKRARWVVLVVPVAAVHLHAGALDALLVWLALAVGAGLEALPAPVGPPTALPAAGRWRRPLLGFAALGLGLGLVAGGLALFAPAGVAVLALPFSFSGNAYWHAHLAEFRPLALDADAALQWPLIALALGGAGLAIARRRGFEALVLAGFTLLALRHVRMIWPLAAVAAPVVATLLGDNERWRGVLGRPVAKILCAGAALLLLLATAADQDARFGLGLEGDGIARRRHPIALIDRARALPEETFVSDGLAGTWLWRNFEPGAPGEGDARHRVLVHNCLECYEEATYRDVYQHIRYALPRWQDKVQALGIRSFLIKHTTPGERRFQGGRPNVRQALFASPEWLLVDFDDVASLYVARAARPQGLEVLEGFPVDPDTGREREDATEAQVRQALAAHAAGRPEVTRSLDMLARRLLRAGDVAAAAPVIAEWLRRDPRAPGAAVLLERLRRAVAAQP